jgi:microcystin-dependent protein
LSDYFIGEIRAFGFNWAPQGWALANGASLSVQQNQALYSLCGTTYGGDGTKNFNLPNLNGRTPVSMGVGSTGTQYPIGVAGQGGAETVTLTTAMVPPHTHNVQASTAAGTAVPPADAILAANGGDTSNPVLKPNLYGTASGNPVVALATQTLSVAGTSAPHPNMQPFTVVNYCIAVAGLYPTRP